MPGCGLVIQKINLRKNNLSLSKNIFLSAKFLQYCQICSSFLRKRYFQENMITFFISFQFISSDVMGVFSYVFCDFGSKFEIFDKDGEESKDNLIESVSQV